MTIKERIRYPFHVMLHPFDGFWCLKSEKKGGVKTAFVLMALLFVTFIFRSYNTGYLAANNMAGEVSVFQLFLVIAVAYLLFCIANWSLTTLMNGEGRFSEILTVTAYAMLPIMIINIPLTLLSNVLTIGELPFYTVFDTVGILWAAALLLIGCMTIHDYSMGKTIVVTLLTVVGMVIIAVLAVLFFNLIQQVCIFFLSLVKEVQFRM